MNTNHRSTTRSLKLLIAAGVVLLPALTCLADSITIKSGTGSVARKGITINKIRKDGEKEVLDFMTENGSPSFKDLDSIITIEADNETLFNQAEVEFDKGNLDAANADYRKAISNTTKEWVKQRANERVLAISAKTGDFMGAVSGFVELARKDPVAASAHKPAVANAKPGQLAPAIAAVARGLGGATTATKLVLNPFLAELYNANGDPTKAKGILDESAKLQPANANPGNPMAGVGNSTASAEAKNVQSDVAITTAGNALADGKFVDAIAAINASKSSFIDPEKQAKALFIIAQAKEGMATAANTPDAWSDAALAYMRVVANFKAQPNAPVADALYKTGVIEEKLQKVAEAETLYKQVIGEFKDSKAAQDAQAALARIKAARG